MVIDWLLKKVLPSVKIKDAYCCVCDSVIMATSSNRLYNDTYICSNCRRKSSIQPVV